MRLLLSCALLFLLTACNSEEPVQHVIGFQEVYPKQSFEAPVAVENAGDASGRLFVVEKEGRIIMMEPTDNGFKKNIYLDITDRVESSQAEQGLLGLAFHPEFRKNGTFYVNYTSPDKQTVISAFRASTPGATKVDAKTERLIMSFEQPYDNHNGGDLAFGPDGFLYIATGDGGGSGDPESHSQNLRSLLGKMLRIDVRPEESDVKYRIPFDNPYINQAAYAREEVYAYGLRNPWRISFDQATGELWAADVGQNEREEVNLIEKGGNYGWNVMEGTQCFESTAGCEPRSMISPVFEYRHGSSGASVTGGHVYRGFAVEEMQGKYVFADFLDGRVWTLEKSGTGKYAAQLMNDRIPGITTFGEDENWEMYAATYDGSLLKLKMLKK